MDHHLLGLTASLKRLVGVIFDMIHLLVAWSQQTVGIPVFEVMWWFAEATDTGFAERPSDPERLF